MLIGIAIGYRRGIRKYPKATNTDVLEKYLEHGVVYEVIQQIKPGREYIAIIRDRAGVQKILATTFSVAAVISVQRRRAPRGR